MAKQERQFVKIKADVNKEDLSIIIKRVNAGEIKWAYYAIEGEVGYQYYVILTKK
jgi:hypothetical protein